MEYIIIYIFYADFREPKDNTRDVDPKRSVSHTFNWSASHGLYERLCNSNTQQPLPESMLYKVTPEANLLQISTEKKNYCGIKNRKIPFKGALKGALIN